MRVDFERVYKRDGTGILVTSKMKETENFLSTFGNYKNKKMCYKLK